MEAALRLCEDELAVNHKKWAKKQQKAMMLAAAAAAAADPAAAAAAAGPEHWASRKGRRSIHMLLVVLEERARAAGLPLPAAAASDASGQYMWAALEARAAALWRALPGGGGGAVPWQFHSEDGDGADGGGMAQEGANAALEVKARAQARWTGLWAGLVGLEKMVIQLFPVTYLSLPPSFSLSLSLSYLSSLGYMQWLATLSLALFLSFPSPIPISYPTVAQGASTWTQRRRVRFPDADPLPAPQT
jgi:hypothetical protein